MIDTVQKMLGPLHRRIMLMVGRAVINALYDDAKIQRVQATLGENTTKEKIERMTEYGFTSAPHPGADAIFLAVGGNQGHTVIIATGDARYRLVGLADGEVALYSDEGDYIWFKRGNNVEVSTQTFTVKATDQVLFDTPIVRSTGDMIDNYTTNGKTMAAQRTAYLLHKHKENGTGNLTDATTTGI